MARHLEANCQLCRRCGDKLMLKGNRCMTPKCVMERRHKTAAVGSRGRRRRVSEHGLQLIEKQKARYIYGLFERQFKRFYGISAKQPGITGDNLKVMLERRLDNVVYRLGIAPTRSAARQLIGHRHVVVNGKVVSTKWGTTHVVKPAWDASLEKDLQKYFDRFTGF